MALLAHASSSSRSSCRDALRSQLGPPRSEASWRRAPAGSPPVPTSPPWRLGVEVRTASLAGATAQVDRTMRDILAGLKSVGVRDADVQTTSYRIDPIAEAQERGGAGARVIGYRVANVVQVKTREASTLGRIVDAAVGARANVIHDVHFTLDDPRRSEAEAHALAVRDAQEKARQVAAAAGGRVGRLLSVSESPPVRRMARMSLATGPGPLEPGELNVVVTLEMRYGSEQ